MLRPQWCGRLDYLPGMDSPRRRPYLRIYLGVPGADLGGQDIVFHKEDAQHGIFNHRHFLPGAGIRAVLYVLLSDYGRFSPIYGKGDRDTEDCRGDCTGDDIRAGIPPKLV